MILVLQRVTRAQVAVDGETVARVGPGIVALVAVERGDGSDQSEWCARKTVEIRMFSDHAGKMNRSVRDIDGDVLAVSQFTLVGDLKKGTRPSFSKAAAPDEAEALFDEYVAHIRSRGIRVKTGVFGAMMEVDLRNDGPVTLIVRRAADPA